VRAARQREGEKERQNLAPSLRPSGLHKCYGPTDWHFPHARTPLFDPRFAVTYSFEGVRPSALVARSRGPDCPLRW
jgi:hypothetical protein